MPVYCCEILLVKACHKKFAENFFRFDERVQNVRHNNKLIIEKQYYRKLLPKIASDANYRTFSAKSRSYERVYKCEV